MRRTVSWSMCLCLASALLVPVAAAQTDADMIADAEEPTAEEPPPVTAPAAEAVPRPPTPADEVGPFGSTPRVAATLATPAVPPAAATDEHADRLEGWLVRQSARASGPRQTSGWIHLVGGLALIPLDSFLISTFDPRFPAFLAVESTLLLGISILYVALGIVELASPSIPERRLERWRARRSEGSVDEAEISRFEGEIHADITHRDQARWAAIAWGSGLVVAGGAGAIVTAFLAQSEDARTLGYSASVIVGVVGLLFGLMSGLIPMLDHTEDDEWDQIERDEGPTLSSVSPWVNQYGAGMSLNGTL